MRDEEREFERETETTGGRTSKRGREGHAEIGVHHNRQYSINSVNAMNTRDQYVNHSASTASTRIYLVNAKNIDCDCVRCADFCQAHPILS